MNQKDFSKSIRKAYSSIDVMELVESFSSPQSIVPNKEFRDIVLSSSSKYKDVYYTGLKYSLYNFILKDFSYFQFSRVSDTNFRYAFYPNPHLMSNMIGIKEIYGVERFADLHGLVIDGYIDEEEYMSILSSLDVEIKAPLIRYEYRPEKDHYIEFYHPSSHFHVGYHSDNRWASNRFWTPYAFAMFIMKQYYSDSWNKSGDTATSLYKNKHLEDLIKDRQDFCRIIAVEFFSAREKRFFSID